MAAVPQMRDALLESASVRLGGWTFFDSWCGSCAYWSKGHADHEILDSYSPFLRAYLTEDGGSEGAYVDAAPDDIMLRALYLRRTADRSYNIIDFDLSEEPELAQAKARMERVIAVAAEGEKQEPNNAFFPLASALAHFSLGNAEASSAALARAAAGEYYKDYWLDSRAEYDEEICDDPYCSPLLSTFEGESAYIRFARRLQQQEPRDVVQLGRFADCMFLVLAQCRSRTDLTAVRRALARLVPDWHKRFENEPDAYRPRNDGDTIRELTRLQDELLAAGYTTRLDLPAAFAIEGEYDVYEEDDWYDEADMALYRYPEVVRMGTYAIEALLGLLAAFLLCLALSRMRMNGWDHAAAVPLLAFVSAVSVLYDAVGIEVCAVIALFYLVSAALAVFRLHAASFAVGLAASLAAAVIGLTDVADENLIMPAFVFAAGWGLYAIRRRSEDRAGWLVAAVVLGVAASSAASTGVVSISYRLAVFAGVFAIGMLIACIWYRSDLAAVARKAVRATPAVALVGVVFLAFTLGWQLWLNAEMTRLAEQDLETAEWIRHKVSQLGPPVPAGWGDVE